MAEKRSLTDYTTKMREIKMLSMLCACLHVNLEPDNTLRKYYFQGMEVKDLNKGKTGQAFEVIIKQPNAAGEGGPPTVVAPSKKREVSLDGIKTKLIAAEERRKSQQDTVINHLKSEREKLEKAKMKKAEANENFVAWAEEHLKMKMSDYTKNHLNQIRSRVEKYKQMNMKPDELREKVTKEVSEMCSQLEENLQKKMDMTQKNREERLQEMKRKLKEQEEHVQQVRQNKIQMASDGQMECEQSPPTTTIAVEQ